MSFGDRCRWLSRGVQACREQQVRVWKLEDLGLAYIQIPKVASNSIRAAIRAHYAETNHQVSITTLRDTGPGQFDSEIRVTMPQSKALAERQNYHIISFVRNPLSRLYSCYRDKLEMAQNRRSVCTLTSFGIHFGMSFEDFVDHISTLSDNMSDQHFRSQSASLVCNGERLPHFVGKLENFADDWSRICDQFGLPMLGRDGLPGMKPSKRVIGKGLGLADIPISASRLEKVMKRYSDDLDYFSYRESLEQLHGQLPKQLPGK